MNPGKTIDQLVAEILNREGPEFTDIIGDTGGPTKYGITLKTLQAFMGPKHPMYAADVLHLTMAQASTIYKQVYIIHPGYGALTNTELVEQMIDAGVQHGVEEAIKLLQETLKVPVDGVMGPGTIAAANAAQPMQLTLLYIAANMRYYAFCLKNQREWKFGGGWINRIAGLVQDLALEQTD
jgi:lysozyme family protein